jgi:hypothetical protein
MRPPPSGRGPLRSRRPPASRVGAEHYPTAVDLSTTDRDFRSRRAAGGANDRSRHLPQDGLPCMRSQQRLHPFQRVARRMAVGAVASCWLRTSRTWTAAGGDRNLDVAADRGSGRLVCSRAGWVQERAARRDEEWAPPRSIPTMGVVVESRDQSSARPPASPFPLNRPDVWRRVVGRCEQAAAGCRDGRLARLHGGHSDRGRFGGGWVGVAESAAEDSPGRWGRQEA